MRSSPAIPSVVFFFFFLVSGSAHVSYAQEGELEEYLKQCREQMLAYRNLVNENGPTAVQSMPRDSALDISRCATVGEVNALFLEGLSHAVGLDNDIFPQDDYFAREALEKAGKLGDLESQKMLAYSYALGIPVALTNDWEKSLTWAREWSRHGGKESEQATQFISLVEKINALYKQRTSLEANLESNADQLKQLEAERKRLLQLLGDAGKLKR